MISFLLTHAVFGCITRTVIALSPVFIHNTTHHKYGHYVLANASRVSSSPAKAGKKLDYYAQTSTLIPLIVDSMVAVIQKVIVPVLALCIPGYIAYPSLHFITVGSKLRTCNLSRW